MKSELFMSGLRTYFISLLKRTNYLTKKIFPCQGMNRYGFIDLHIHISIAMANFHVIRICNKNKSAGCNSLWMECMENGVLQACVYNRCSVRLWNLGVYEYQATSLYNWSYKGLRPIIRLGKCCLWNQGGYIGFWQWS